MDNSRKIEKPPNYKINAICGGLAGTFSKLILQPLDFVRTRFQAQDNSFSRIPKYKNMRHALVSIFKNEGIRGFYTAAGPSMFGSSAAWCIYFFVYNKSKSFAREFRGSKEIRQMDIFMSGMLASGLTMSCTNPIWFLKTRLQLQSRVYSDKKLRYKNTFDAVRRIFKEEGPLTFYRGIGPALALSITGTLQIFFYENLRKVVVKLLPKNDNPLSTWMTLSMGGATKGLASTITYPLLVVKCGLQQRAGDDVLKDSAEKQKYKNSKHVVKTVFLKEGVKGFYKGLTPHLMKTMPGTAITFSTYEFLIRRMGARW